MVNDHFLHAEMVALVASWGLETEHGGVYHGHDCHGGVAVGDFIADATVKFSLDVSVVTHFEVLGVSSSRLNLRHHPAIFFASVLLFSILTLLHESGFVLDLRKVNFHLFIPFFTSLGTNTRFMGFRETHFNVFFMSVDANLTRHNNLQDDLCTVNLAFSVVHFAISNGNFLRGEDSLVEFDLQFGVSLVNAAPGLDVVSILLLNVGFGLLVLLTDHESSFVLEIFISSEVELCFDGINGLGQRFGFNLLVFIVERRGTFIREFEVEHSLVVSGCHLGSTELNFTFQKGFSLLVFIFNSL